MIEEKCKKISKSVVSDSNSMPSSSMSPSSIWRWLVTAVSSITVEPVEFLYCLMFTTSNVVRDNLFLEKVCRLDMNYTEEFCYNLTHGGVDDDEMKKNIQERVAQLEIWDMLIYNFPSVFFCLFAGAWSDYNGRKLLLIIPFIGNILSYIAYMVNYYYFYELGTNHLLWGSIAGVFGGFQCLNLGLYGYISDVSSVTDRTMRLSILNGVFSFGYVVGTQLGSVMYTNVKDFYSIFGLSCLLGVFGILYSMFIVKESVTRDPDHLGVGEYSPFDLGNVTASFRTAFKRRPNGGRVKLLLLIANFAIFMLPLNSNRFDYLLFQLRFKWTILEYSNYLTAQRLFRMLGLFLLLPFLSRVAKVNDALVATVLTLVTTVAYLLIAIGVQDWLMYLSAALQFNSVITVIIRSQCTKTVDPDETGRVFAVVALGQALVPLAAGPLLGGLYQATIDTFAGAYMLIIVGLLAVAFLNSVYLWWALRRTTTTTPHVSMHESPLAQDDNEGGNSNQL